MSEVLVNVSDKERRLMDRIAAEKRATETMLSHIHRVLADVEQAEGRWWTDAWEKYGLHGHKQLGYRNGEIISQTGEEVKEESQ